MFTVCHIGIYRYGNVTFHVMDIGASRPSGFHTMERAFFNQADVVVWVVDTDDCDTYLESREELVAKVNHGGGMPRDAPLLILANKQDPKDVEAVQKMATFFFDQELSAFRTRTHRGIERVKASIQDEIIETLENGTDREFVQQTSQ
ncbi:hypothetical protein FSHL1_008020 [Fusarium sambucinum]